VRLELAFRLADAFGRKLGHFREIHVRQDAAQLDRRKLVLGGEIENPGPGPAGAAEGGEAQRQLWRRLPGYQQCSSRCDKLSASSHGVAPETNFEVRRSTSPVLQDHGDEVYFRDIKVRPP